MVARFFHVHIHIIQIMIVGMTMGLFSSRFLPILGSSFLGFITLWVIIMSPVSLNLLVLNRYTSAMAVLYIFLTIIMLIWAKFSDRCSTLLIVTRRFAGMLSAIYFFGRIVP
jgi:membrane protease YdiL (CAAX protease family)